MPTAASGASQEGVAESSQMPDDPSSGGHSIDPSVSSGSSPGSLEESDAGSAAHDAGGQAATASIDENGSYTSKDDVALYIHTYGHLPSNFISKSKAKKAGWVANKGNLDQVAPGKSIGGSEFYNYEGQLPDAPGRTWTECDINYEGGFRGAERIVFSNDGLVFYTGDHYETFEQLY